MAQHEDMVDSIFKSLFGDAWDKMFIGEPNFFGELLTEVNNFAVILIVVISLITTIGGLLRLGQKREFLGRGQTVSFWMIRLVLFIGCCYPAINGYSIAQGLLLKVGVRYSADIGNKISDKAFDAMANKGMLPIGSVFVQPDRTLMYRTFENAVCFSYMHNEMKRGERHTDKKPKYIYPDGLALKTDNNFVMPDIKIILGLLNNVSLMNVKLTFGARWGGKSDTKVYPQNVCGEITYVCSVPSKDLAGSKENINAMWGVTGSAGHEINHEGNTPNLPFNKHKINAQHSGEIVNIKRTIELEAQNYCMRHGKAVVEHMIKVQELADRLVTGEQVSRGELEAIQKSYEIEVAGFATELNSKLSELIKEKIGKSTVREDVKRNGFLMLGFYYYQISRMIDDARDAVSIKPTITHPDYLKIDPNLEEGKGIKSFLLMSDSYRNSEGTDCIDANNKVKTNDPACSFDNNKKNYKKEGSPGRQDDYVMKKIGENFNPESFSTMFERMDPDHPVSSIIDLGSNLLNTGTTVMGVFVATDIIVHTATNSIGGKMLNFWTGLSDGAKRTLHWLGKGVMLFSIYLMSCGMFLLFVVPSIPLITWVFTIFAWLIIVIESIVAIPFWAVAASTATGDGFVADTGRTGMTLFLNVIIRPILLPIFFFFAIALGVIFSKIIMSGLHVFLDGQIDNDNIWYLTPSWFFSIGWKIFVGTYLFVMAFKMSHEIMAKGYDYIMRFVSSSGRSDYGTDSANSDMMSRGMAASQVATNVSTSLAKEVGKKSDKNNGDDSRNGDEESSDDSTRADAKPESIREGYNV